MDAVCNTHPPVTRELTANDITWASAPLEITTDDVLVEALTDAESYRAVAQEALQALAALTAKHKRLLDVHRRLLEAYRELRGAR
jgi:hypothetical protein